jgi:hypothetical protein
MTICFYIFGTPTIIVQLKNVKEHNDMMKFYQVVCAPLPIITCDMQLHLSVCTFKELHRISLDETMQNICHSLEIS